MISSKSASIPATRISEQGGTPKADAIGFIPDSLMLQCQGLIRGYHDLYGYACLPDILWRARLGQLIEKRQDFRRLLRKASTTRSAKKSNDAFVTIATTILSLEILASDFSGWSVMFPDARLLANGILQCSVGSAFAPLIENYLYPPKNIPLSRLVAVTPPSHLLPVDGDVDAALTHRLDVTKQSLSHAKPVLRDIPSIKPTRPQLSRSRFDPIAPARSSSLS